MSYHIYTTEGIILSEMPIREADKIYSVLTRDLGLIRATAMGVRKESSKLRGNVEPFSLAKVSFVKGREYWRLTSAELIQKIASSEVIARPLALLEKLIQGEVSNPELFDTVKEKITTTTSYDEMFEASMVSKILFHLGYLKEADLNLSKKDLIKAINHGLQSSHLT